MEKIDCTVRFLTPAFLGDAEQHGAWRSPPFKALLRQWWRVVAAQSCRYNFEVLRETEGRLFGHAWLGHLENGREKSWAAQSRVRLRLDRWESGKMRQWSNDPKVKHPEVEKTPVIGAHLYLGYGPLTFNKGTTLKNACTIEAGETAGLRLGVGPEDRQVLLESLQLIHWFGTVGGRSRNGWGSLALENAQLGHQGQLLNGQALSRLEKVTRPLSDCLNVEWPHAIGRDNKALLLWKTKETFGNWSDAMKSLAQIKIDFRTQLKFECNKDIKAPVLDARHLLSYPVTHHGVNGWVEKDRYGNFKTDKRGNLIQGDRLANQLRFKVVQQEDKRYVGFAFHLPCGLPRELLEKLDKNEQARLTPAYQGQVWQQVHRVLDQRMCRIQGGR